MSSLWDSALANATSEFESNVDKSLRDCCTTGYATKSPEFRRFFGFPQELN